MKILGYSERGIINSLIFNIGNDIVLMNQFIRLITLPNPIELGEPKDYVIFLEQSLSRFGDSDLIIIVKYKKKEDQIVLFFEGKVKTSNKNWIISSEFNKFNNLEYYNYNKSNLFFQLHLKKLLIDNWPGINVNGGVEEPKFGDFRKIGNNNIVLKAFDLIDNSRAFYIGIIPTLHEEIKSFTKNNKSDLYFLSWATIYKFCEDHELQKVLEIFEYNRGQIY